jgi:hypothetical protein
MKLPPLLRRVINGCKRREAKKELLYYGILDCINQMLYSLWVIIFEWMIQVISIQDTFLEL